MKTRKISTRILVIVVAAGMLASVWAVWGARPAEAIIPAEKSNTFIAKSGALTLTRGQSLRIHVANTDEERGVQASLTLFDRDSNRLEAFPPRNVVYIMTESFDYIPMLMEGESLIVRIEVTVELPQGSKNLTGVIPSGEVVAGDGTTQHYFTIEFSGGRID